MEKAKMRIMEEIKKLHRPKGKPINNSGLSAVFSKLQHEYTEEERMEGFRGLLEDEYFQESKEGLIITEKGYVLLETMP
ncbi:MAG: hypothetical protein WCT14_12905 [Treponemataceae bacterium]